MNKKTMYFDSGNLETKFLKAILKIHGGEF